MGKRRRSTNRYSVTKVKKTNSYAIRYTRDGGRTWRQESLDIEATDRNRSKAVRAAADRAKELFVATGDDVPWRDFCDRYETEYLTGLSAGSAESWKTCRNTIEESLNPQWLDDLDSQALSKLAAAMRRRKLSENTIKSRMGGISAALGWARRVGFIDSMPEIPKPPRARGVNRKARSRPITGEEFDRMLANVEVGLLYLEESKPKDDAPRKRKVSEPTREKRRERQRRRIADAAPLWRRFLCALWLSGLRRDEACNLSWDWGADFSVDLEGRYPQYRIKVKGQKSARDQLCPMAPEFAAFLNAIPNQERKGRVLGVTCTSDHAGRVVSAIGHVSRIVVSTDGKTATAHDLRRAFGTRWAVRVQPAVLKELMRHRQISTTMEYYVDLDQATIAAELWRHVPTVQGELVGEPQTDSTRTRIFNEP